MPRDADTTESDHFDSRMMSGRSQFDLVSQYKGSSPTNLISYDIQTGRAQSHANKPTCGRITFGCMHWNSMRRQTQFCCDGVCSLLVASDLVPLRQPLCFANSSATAWKKGFLNWEFSYNVKIKKRFLLGGFMAWIKSNLNKNLEWQLVDHTLHDSLHSWRLVFPSWLVLWSTIL